MNYTERQTVFTEAIAAKLAAATDTVIRNREMTAWLNGGGRKVDRIIRDFLGVELYRAAAKHNAILRVLESELKSYRTL